MTESLIEKGYDIREVKIVDFMGKNREHNQKRYSPKEIKERGELYFLQTDKPTVAGLTHFCGFGSRSSFDSYRRDPRYKHILDNFMLQIESKYEEQASYYKNSSVNFVLKNMFGWRDEVNVNSNIAIEAMQRLEALPTEKILELIGDDENGYQVGEDYEEAYEEEADKEGCET